jgi:hypothetical protein
MMTSLGLSIFSRLFPIIYGYCAIDEDVSERNMKKYLSYLLEETPDHRDLDFKDSINISWWHKVDGPGLIRGGGEALSKEIAQKLAEKMIIIARKQ